MSGTTFTSALSGGIVPGGLTGQQLSYITRRDRKSTRLNSSH